jgi:DNA repair protein RadC
MATVFTVKQETLIARAAAAIKETWSLEQARPQLLIPKDATTDQLIEVNNNKLTLQSYLQFKYSAEPREIFSVVIIDAPGRWIDLVELQRGTVDSVSTHPRELVRALLDHNASGCVLVHNHPSGSSRPSEQDCKITPELASLLSSLDVVMHDHLVVARDGVTSIRRVMADKAGVTTEPERMSQFAGRVTP